MYGVDTNYFSKKLKRIISSLNNYTPQELARELARLAKTADEVAARGELVELTKGKEE